MIIVLLIILLIISGLVTAVVITIKKASNNIQSHIIKDDDTKTSGVSCPVSEDINILRRCDITDINSCGDCTGGGVKNSCIEVSDSKPYEFETNGKKILIPSGNWCLPAIQKKPDNFKCNSFSGYPILSKLNDSDYAWKCQCNYPSLFENEGVFGDCTSQVACTPGNLVCPPDSISCTPGQSWLDNPNWDPAKGVCDCPQGMKYTEYNKENLGIINKTCVNDSCVPGKYLEEGKCECPSMTQDDSGFTSYIDCPNDIPHFANVNSAYCTPNYPQCLKDPCNPGGYWDAIKQSCICDRTKEYISKQDKSSIVKMVCYKPCVYTKLCASRGKCNITNCQDPTKNKAYCADCTIPYKTDGGASGDDLCNIEENSCKSACDTIDDEPTKIACEKKCEPDLCTGYRKKNGYKCNHHADCASGDCHHYSYGYRCRGN
jgi:hypothetical protein